MVYLMEYDNSSDELLIAYLFPPSKDVSGMVAAKEGSGLRTVLAWYTT